MRQQNDRNPSQPQDGQATPDPDEPGNLVSSAAPRRRRWALAVAVAGALAAVASVVILIAGSAGGSPATPTWTGKRTAAQKEIGALLSGIPQSGNTLGRPTAPVTMQFFGDLQCPTARTFALIALPYLIREWVREGTVRIEFHSLRSVSEPEAFDAQQVAALAAGVQDRLWDYLEYFYLEQGQEHSGYVTEGYLRSRAREVSGLDLQQWNEARGDPRLATQVSEDEELARTMRLSGTPSFLIGPTGSAPPYSLGESSTLEEINSALDQALQSQRS
jgi:protein-disulfide isomerase